MQLSSALSLPRHGWTIDTWRTAMSSGELSIEGYLTWLASFPEDDPAWIFRPALEDVREQLLRIRRTGSGRDLALFGVPIAVKDNIDIKGWPTTAACPAFSYVAECDAHVVQLLREAGAIFVGKTNLDQFATGLVGTRSPYGAVPNTFNNEYISGGSSSGSASVVARGFVPVSLGTDTAGSGRVPAAFNQIVGLKPSRGLLSTRGLVPACKTLDCVSIFALTVPDAALIAQVTGEYDAHDPYARRVHKRLTKNRRKLGVLVGAEFFGDRLAKTAYEETCALCERLGYQLLPVDFAPFTELADLLYASAWVAERSLVAKKILAGPKEWMDPTVRTILNQGPLFTAEQAFLAEYRRVELARSIAQALADVDALMVPTTPTIYRTSEVLADPLGTNARLGSYTNFTNLADLCGLAIPSVPRRDGLPAGITLLTGAFGDALLVEIARDLQMHIGLNLGATGRACSSLSEAERHIDGSKISASGPRRSAWVDVAVVGAHLSGMALHFQLQERGAELVFSGFTAPCYRLFALPGTQPEKPGLVRAPSGRKIALEVFRLSTEAFGSFVQIIPPPLGIGNVELEDGSWVKGFICESYGLTGATEITEFGGFRAYLNSKS